MNNHECFSGPVSSMKESVDLLCEFLETCIHMILFKRSLYSPDLFTRKKRFGSAVPMATHPQLASYIYEMVLAIKPELEKKQVEEVHVVILAPSEIPIERFRFKFTPRNAAAMDALQLQPIIRAISVCDALLAPIPQNSTFTMVMEMASGEPVRHGEDVCPWSPSQPDDGFKVEFEKSSSTSEEDLVINPNFTQNRSSMAGSILHCSTVLFGTWKLVLTIEESIFKSRT
ncbi:MAD2 mitotic arrest deficient-like 2 [Entomophthora muscae]|uniref:MAD2 mitotic arrest deficient-like 2 n=4 Tax=Entomophthora muscae TaxID=34485 RepID=A0ACC2TGX0_9FUNG|nr:MAD2 mitotic arrest deficient-like 2 [Entomophthora muscae]KAJ9073944.1 MAD2 mitotic arrest deficient-like 2 [Entomophthora muscae]